MSNYNPNSHDRKSIRLKGYDYAQEGLYFLTFCCHNRKRHFGKVENGLMILNQYGQIAFDEWLKTPTIRPNVELGEFVIMPNHVHGIVRLTGRGELHSPLESAYELPCNPPGECNPPGGFNPPGECNSPLRSPSQSIGAIVRGYKSAVTKQLGLMGFDEKLWQRNYYDRIIRDENAHQRISDYILNNPAKWQKDKFFK